MTFIRGAGQYYVQGEVKNENGINLQNVSIKANSSLTASHTNQDGKFQIWITRQEDTLYFSAAGYQSSKIFISSANFQTIILKKDTNNAKRDRLTSLVGYQNGGNEILTYGNETYSALVENPIVSTTQASSISFTVNTNLASYSNVRRFINMNSIVPPDAVRIEEMLNYFNFNYTEPQKNQDFHVSSILSPCPWNVGHKLFFLSVSARKLDMQTVPPGNLVFLIDISGSMDLPNKLPLIKSGLRLLVNNLRNIDTVSIVVYGSVLNVVLEGISGNQKDTINKAIEILSPQGSTPGEAGLKLAYKVAKRRFINGGNNRIILATDGDFNVGVSTEKELEELIGQQGETGIHLTCLGVGIGNYKDSKLSLLAQKGQGNFAYIDNELEAEKVLVTEFTQTLFTVAENVFLTTNFDSSLVKNFRLIGYDNRRNSFVDSLSKLEGGEIGSGHSLLAIFEVEADSEFKNNQNLAELTIHYHLPGQLTEQKKEFVCPFNFTPYERLDSAFQKAINILMFGMKLKWSVYAKDIHWKYIEGNAKKVFDELNPLDQQYLQLLSKAKEIYSKKKYKED
jgi:Ca-activated chloride channel family protein